MLGKVSNQIMMSKDEMSHACPKLLAKEDLNLN